MPQYFPSRADGGRDYAPSPMVRGDVGNGTQFSHCNSAGAGYTQPHGLSIPENEEGYYQTWNSNGKTVGQQSWTKNQNMNAMKTLNANVLPLSHPSRNKTKDHLKKNSLAKSLFQSSKRRNGTVSLLPPHSHPIISRTSTCTTSVSTTPFSVSSQEWKSHASSSLDKDVRRDNYSQTSSKYSKKVIGKNYDGRYSDRRETGHDWYGHEPTPPNHWHSNRDQYPQKFPLGQNGPTPGQTFHRPTNIPAVVTPTFAKKTFREVQNAGIHTSSNLDKNVSSQNFFPEDERTTSNSTSLSTLLQKQHEYALDTTQNFDPFQHTMDDIDIDMTLKRDEDSTIGTTTVGTGSSRQHLLRDKARKCDRGSRRKDNRSHIRKMSPKSPLGKFIKNRASNLSFGLVNDSPTNKNKQRNKLKKGEWHEQEPSRDWSRGRSREGRQKFMMQKRSEKIEQMMYKTAEGQGTTSMGFLKGSNANPSHNIRRRSPSKNRSRTPMRVKVESYSNPTDSIRKSSSKSRSPRRRSPSKNRGSKPLGIKVDSYPNPTDSPRRRRRSPSKERTKVEIDMERLQRDTMLRDGMHCRDKGIGGSVRRNYGRFGGQRAGDSVDAVAPADDQYSGKNTNNDNSGSGKKDNGTAAQSSYRPKSMGQYKLSHESMVIDEAGNEFHDFGKTQSVSSAIKLFRLQNDITPSPKPNEINRFISHDEMSPLVLRGKTTGALENDQLKPSGISIRSSRLPPLPKVPSRSNYAEGKPAVADALPETPGKSLDCRFLSHDEMSPLVTKKMIEDRESSKRVLSSSPPSGSLRTFGSSIRAPTPIIEATSLHVSPENDQKYRTSESPPILSQTPQKNLRGSGTFLDSSWQQSPIAFAGSFAIFDDSCMNDSQDTKLARMPLRPGTPLGKLVQTGSEPEFIKVVAAIVIQTFFRRHLAYKLTWRRYSAVLKIQRFFHSVLEQRRTNSVILKQAPHRFYDLAAAQIQAAWRGWWVRDCMKVETYCASIIQCTFRAYSARLTFKFDIYRVIVAQSVARRFLVRLRLVKEQKEIAAILIQSQLRAYLAKKKSMRTLMDILIVQCMCRRFLARKKLERLRIKRSLAKIAAPLSKRSMLMRAPVTHSEKTLKWGTAREKKRTANAQKMHGRNSTPRSRDLAQLNTDDLIRKWKSRHNSKRSPPISREMGEF